MQFIINHKAVEVNFPKPTPDSSSRSAKARRIWQNWRNLRLLDLQLRSGVIYCGAYDSGYLQKQGVAESSNVKSALDAASSEYRAPTLDSVIKGMLADSPAPHTIELVDLAPALTGIGLNRPESVGDHVHSCENLLWLLTQEYPHLFTREHEDPHLGVLDDEVQLATQRLIALLKYHDIAETFICDIPDDGARNEYMKDRTELTYFLSLIQTIGNPQIREQLVYDFVNFLDPKALMVYPGWTKYDSELIQIAKLIDKVDACLTVIKLEAECHGGDLLKKDGRWPISDRDRKSIELCNSSLIADCWTAQFITHYHRYYGFSFILDIIRAAVLEVRGEWFSWWDKVADTYHIAIPEDDVSENEPPNQDAD